MVGRFVFLIYLAVSLSEDGGGGGGGGGRGGKNWERI